MDPVATIVLVGEIGVVVGPGADLGALDGEGAAAWRCCPPARPTPSSPAQRLVLAAKTIVAAAAGLVDG